MQTRYLVWLCRPVVWCVRTVCHFPPQFRRACGRATQWLRVVDYVWNVIAPAQRRDFVFRRNGRVHLNRRGLQFSRLLAAEVCASVVVMLDKPCSEVVWRVLATHSIRQFPLHFPSRASPYAITFQLDCTTGEPTGCDNRWGLDKIMVL